MKNEPLDETKNIVGVITKLEPHELPGMTSTHAVACDTAGESGVDGQLQQQHPQEKQQQEQQQE